MDDPTDIVTRLRQQARGVELRFPVNPREAADEIERLRAERDEARREVCYMKDFHGLPQDYAEERGWDCFKHLTAE